MGGKLSDEGELTRSLLIARQRRFKLFIACLHALQRIEEGTEVCGIAEEILHVLFAVEHQRKPSHHQHPRGGGELPVRPTKETAFEGKD